MNVVVGAGVTVGFPVPVTMKVYVPADVPGLLFEPPLVTLPPQADKLPSAVITIRIPSIERQLRRRAGIPRKTRSASTAPPPAPAQPPPGSLG